MKKQLLNETEVRSFMKFANLQPLTETFFDRIEEDDITEGDDELTGLEGPAAPDEPVTDEPVTDEPVTDEPVEDDVLAPEDDMSAEAPEVTWNLTAEEAGIIAPVLEDLASQVKAVAGDEGDPDAAGLEVPPEEPPADPEAMAIAEPEVSPEDDEEVGALAESEIYISENGPDDVRKTTVVNEVARRVAKRLVAATRKSKTRKRK